MRAVLLVNPKATTTSERARDVLVRALRSEVDLSVRYTRQRGHATTLAREAAEEGVDAVVTLGGDGTVNEVVNGLMTATTAGGAEPTADRLPALATVPGVRRTSSRGPSACPGMAGRRQHDHGGTAAGPAPHDRSRPGRRPLLHLLRRLRARRVGDPPGRGGAPPGPVSSPSLYFRAFSAQFLLGSERRHPAIQLERPGEATEGELATIIVQNTAPWTYVGDREVNPNPGASFDLGLDVLALRQLGVASTTRTVTQFFSPTPDPRGRQVLRLHDVAEFTLVASRPQAFQLDGDYLGEREKVRFTSVPAALRVIC